MAPDAAWVPWWGASDLRGKHRKDKGFIYSQRTGNPMRPAPAPRAPCRPAALCRPTLTGFFLLCTRDATTSNAHLDSHSESTVSQSPSSTRPNPLVGHCKWARKGTSNSQTGSVVAGFGVSAECHACIVALVPTLALQE